MRTTNRIYVFAILLITLCSLNMEISAQGTEDLVPGIAPMIPVPGYVILSSGDTLYGQIKWAMKYTENNPVEIKFTAENGASKSFNASEIPGFGNQLKVWEENVPQPFLMEPEHYISVPSYKKGVPVFMHRLLDGRITVIQNRSAAIIGSSSSVAGDTRIDGIEFTFIPGEGLIIGPSYRTDYRIIKSKSHFTSYYVKKDGGAMIKVEKENYETLFRTLFGDCSAVEQEIARNPDMIRFKNFLIMAEVYNSICK